MMEDKVIKLLSTIPDKFIINCQEYSVKYYDDLTLNDEPHLGLTHMHKVNPEIQLALTLGKDWKLSNGSILNTYYHELCHVLLDAAGIEDDELKVQSLANVLMQYEMSKEKINASSK